MGAGGGGILQSSQVETIVIVSQSASQMKIARKQSASSSVEPAHKCKISMHSPSSNANTRICIIIKKALWQGGGGMVDK